MIKKVLTFVTTAIALAAILFLGLERDAGWPHDLSDLEDRWILDGVRGEFTEGPSAMLTFSHGSAGPSTTNGSRSTW